MKKKKSRGKLYRQKILLQFYCLLNSFTCLDVSSREQKVSNETNMKQLSGTFLFLVGKFINFYLTGMSGAYYKANRFDIVHGTRFSLLFVMKEKCNDQSIKVGSSLAPLLQLFP